MGRVGAQELLERQNQTVRREKPIAVHEAEQLNGVAALGRFSPVGLPRLEGPVRVRLRILWTDVLDVHLAIEVPPGLAVAVV